MEKFFIGILLPEKLSWQIDVWRRTYYPIGSRLVPPHITLVKPFILKNQEYSLSKEIQQTADLSTRFDITVSNFGAFSHQSSAFFAKVKPSGELSVLHKRLCRVVTSELSALSVLNNWLDLDKDANRVIAPTLHRREIIYNNIYIKEYSTVAIGQGEEDLRLLNRHSSLSEQMYAPHITIANRLSRTQFDHLVSVFSHVELHEKFQVGSIHLFSKKEGESYKAVEEYALDKK